LINTDKVLNASLELISPLLSLVIPPKKVLIGPSIHGSSKPSKIDDR